jgi:hypothetical protein
MALQVNNSAVNNTGNATTPNKGKDTPDSASNTQSQDSIQLSTRAQKIQKLNQEFFPDGPHSLRITPGFIQRLQEFGFISNSEAEGFGANLASNALSSGNELPGTIGDISRNIEAITQRVSRINSEDDLVGILQRSDAILQNLDGSKPNALASDIRTVNAELSNYLNSTEADELTEQEKSALNELNTALKVADKLNPANLSTQKLNQYLAFL